MGSGSSLFSFFKKQNDAAILPLVEQHVPKDAVIIDADAGAGTFTKLFAGAVPHGHVYAFEPGKALRSILAKVIAVRNLRNGNAYHARPVRRASRPQESGYDPRGWR